MNNCVVIRKNADQTVRSSSNPRARRRAAICECCGRSATGPFSRKRSVSLWRCANCGLVYVSPQPTAEELRRLYTKENGYYTAAKVDLSSVPPSSNRWLHELLTQAEAPGNHLLDIGCANGQLIYHMATFGWQVCGIDINRDAVEIARQNGLDARATTLERSDLPDASFDAVHLGDVIEHVPSPHDQLSRVYRLLRPGGVVVIRTPNNRNGFARLTAGLSRLTRFSWPQSEAPYHLFEFSPQSLVGLLLHLGFAVVGCESSGRTSFLYRLGSTGCFDELKLSLKSSGRRLLVSKQILQIPKLFGVGLLLAPFYVLGAILSWWTGQGDSLVVVARKELKVES